jgi:hypothetical protein
VPTGYTGHVLRLAALSGDAFGSGKGIILFRFASYFLYVANYRQSLRQPRSVKRT